jgi:hypothetical protein
MDSGRRNNLNTISLIGPGSYLGTEIGNTRNGSAKYGFGNRSEKKLPQLTSLSRGPGAYEPDRVNQSFSAHKGYTISAGQKRLHDINYEKAKSIVPGPGNYETSKIPHK